MVNKKLLTKIKNNLDDCIKKQSKLFFDKEDLTKEEKIFLMDHITKIQEERDIIQIQIDKLNGVTDEQLKKMAKHLFDKMQSSVK